MTDGTQSDNPAPGNPTPGMGSPGVGSSGRDNAHAVIEEVLGGFRGVCRGAMIFRSITSAMQPGRLIIALLMVMVLMAGGRVWDGMTAPDASTAGEIPGSFAIASAGVRDCFMQFVRSSSTLDCSNMLDAGYNFFIALPTHFWEEAPGFTVGYGLFFLIVLALGGGSLARSSAELTSTGRRLRAHESANYALSHWVTLIFTPLLPLIIVVVLGLVLAGVAWVFFSVPFLDILGGVGYALALLGGFLITFLVIGYLASFPMLIPAYCCETSDAGDAMQRAYAYVLQRPLHLAWYFLLALLGLVLGYLVVALFAVCTLNLTAGLTGLWTDHVGLADAGGYSIFNLTPTTPVMDEESLTFSEKWTLGIVDFWRVLVGYLVVSWVFSYLCSASTTIYLLMRKVVDGQSIEEIWEPRTAD